MKLRFFESLAGTNFSFRADRTYDVVPDQPPSRLSQTAIIRLVAKGTAQPEGEAAEKEFNGWVNTKDGKKILETAALR